MIYMKTPFKDQFQINLFTFITKCFKRPDRKDKGLYEAL